MSQLNTVTRRRHRRYRLQGFRARFLQDMHDFPDAPNILCEGDSWFGYPRKDLLDHIAELGRFNLLRTEKSGDELLKDMMRGDQRERLERNLNQFNFDLVLFSGGGNDILGVNLKDFLLKKADRNGNSDAPEDYLAPAFNQHVQQMDTAYREIHALAQAGRTPCALMVHGYDQVYPGDKGFEFFGFTITGPWIKPTMDRPEYDIPHDQSLRNAIVATMLHTFNVMLSRLGDDPALPEFHYVKLLGTLTAAKRNWDNEIHPSSRGFKKLAEHYRLPMKQLLGSAVNDPDP